jgi:hypothetical protein
MRGSLDPHDAPVIPALGSFPAAKIANVDSVLSESGRDSVITVRDPKGSRDSWGFLAFTGSAESNFGRAYFFSR